MIGSGIMGSRIACHFANTGAEVLLLDIVPQNLTAEETAAGKTLSDKAVRNRIVNSSLQAAIKSNPSPLFTKHFSTRIQTGNLEDHISFIQTSDWIIEAVTERLDVKQKVFELVEKHRKPGSLVSTNTSGIPIHMLIEGRSEDFKLNFLGTHFFNPPRYLQLLELIPTPSTAANVVSFLEDYGRRILGKTVVICKDTPAFIANRIGVFSIQWLFHFAKGRDFTVEDIDNLTGTILGRPKSATFRTCDVVGLDTLVHVARGVQDNCPDDESRAIFAIPEFVSAMVEKGWIGDKNKQGFYLKSKNDKGETSILSLNLKTLEYQPQQKTKYSTIEKAKAVESLSNRMNILFDGEDAAGDFYRHSFCALFAYVSHRIPEISDDLFRIDDAMKAGFGWQLGPFQIWDAVGVKKGLDWCDKLGYLCASWVKEMLTAGEERFYSNDEREYWSSSKKIFEPIPGVDDILTPSKMNENSLVWQNKAAALRHLGDGILVLGWQTKMNTIGAEVIEALNKSIDIAEQSYRGLVLYNEGENFSAGANVGLIFMLAANQEYDELDMAVRTFQKTCMRMRYSAIPVVAAPHQLTLGGGCEISMHCDKVVAHAELYMGLVEFGVGVIPGGGGTKEFALRYSDELKDGDIRLNTFRNRFLTIGQAKVSTSAEEAFELGYLRRGVDEYTMSRSLQLTRAKEACLELANRGYTQPAPRKDIHVLGKEGLGIIYVGANSMRSGHYISEHDQLISEKLGYVLAGGDLSATTEVSEQYLLDLERKAFLELCSERKTLERMQSLVNTGKILRN